MRKTGNSYVRAACRGLSSMRVDDYNSKFLKSALVSKLYSRKFPETSKLISVLCRLPK